MQYSNKIILHNSEKINLPFLGALYETNFYLHPNIVQNR